MTKTETAHAVVMEAPRQLDWRCLPLSSPGPEDIVVRTRFSGISTGTERLFYTGEMPSFPGMGYPLVPGYETVGEVVEAGPASSGVVVGDLVFVPGASCWGPVRGLFGGAGESLVVPSARVVKIHEALEEQAVLFALAATGHHALSSPAGQRVLPDLIVGHGALGRLLARLTVALGGLPVVWEVEPSRRAGATGYRVVDPSDSKGQRFKTIVDVSGHAPSLNDWVAHLAPGGELVLAGFYTETLPLNFVPAFLREARIRVAAQWQPADMIAVRDLAESGRLSLDGLVTHHRPADDAPAAYEQAFSDPQCLKMVLDWRSLQ
ncbi:MAG: chlorophyll synthesis pathway protein BchC [Burkholderiaceae bacterium]